MKKIVIPALLLSSSLLSTTITLKSTIDSGTVILQASEEGIWTAKQCQTDNKCSGIELPKGEFAAYLQSKIESLGKNSHFTSAILAIPFFAGAFTAMTAESIARTPRIRSVLASGVGVLVSTLVAVKYDVGTALFGSLQPFWTGASVYEKKHILFARERTRGHSLVGLYYFSAVSVGVTFWNLFTLNRNKQQSVFLEAILSIVKSVRPESKSSDTALELAYTTDDMVSYLKP